MTRLLPLLFAACACFAAPSSAAPIRVDFTGSVTDERYFDNAPGYVGEVMSGSFVFDVDRVPDVDYVHPVNPNAQVHRWYEAVTEASITLGGLTYAFAENLVGNFGRPYAVAIDNFPANQISAPNDPPFRDSLGFSSGVAGPGLDGYQVARFSFSLLKWGEAGTYPSVLSGPELTQAILQGLSLADFGEATAQLNFFDPTGTSPWVEAQITAFSVSSAVPLPAGVLLLTGGLAALCFAPARRRALR